MQNFVFPAKYVLNGAVRAAWNLPGGWSAGFCGLHKHQFLHRRRFFQWDLVSSLGTDCIRFVLQEITARVTCSLSSNLHLHVAGGVQFLQHY